MSSSCSPGVGSAIWTRVSAGACTTWVCRPTAEPTSSGWTVDGFWAHATATGGNGRSVSLVLLLVMA